MKLTTRYQGFRDLLLDNAIITDAHWMDAVGEAARRHKGVIAVLSETGQLTPALGLAVLEGGLRIAEGHSMLRFGLSNVDEIDEFLALPASALLNGSLLATMLNYGMLPINSTELALQQFKEFDVAQEDPSPASPFLLELIPSWLMEKESVLPLYKLQNHLMGDVSRNRRKFRAAVCRSSA